MRFAFSTLCCPGWDFETLANRAREFGFEGVEIHGFLNEHSPTAANIFVADPEAVRERFAAAGVAIAALASSIAVTSEPRRDHVLAEDLRKYIDLARLLGCPWVKLRDTRLRRGQSRAAAISNFKNWIEPLADYAAERGVSLLIENALAFRTARPMWELLEGVCHYNVAVAWDVAAAWGAGDSPAVSVPTLNSRIQYAIAGDRRNGGPCKLGEGDVPVETFILRLRGIGFNGWCSFHWPKALEAHLAEPQEVLPHAIEKLRLWSTPPAATKVKKPVATA